jgi:nitroimidazol reductase NimA-like FMN-containing flavoprotein (pyridoxamine 5'-phosphate oxidase superfamily)
MAKADCEALIERQCFGHLAFARKGHADVLPIRYTFLEGWVYFRADRDLREVIARSPWLVLSVTESRDATHVSSVIARGSCFETDTTGTPAGDAAALRGIMELRDRPTVGRERAPRVRRSSTVYGLHVDEVRGITAFVPCPAGTRSYGAPELEHLRDIGGSHTTAEDERADDDGMAEANPPRPQRGNRIPRAR